MILPERYTHEFQSQWNDFNSKSKNGLFFFNRGYMDYHSDRFEDHSLIFKKEKSEEILAVFPANAKGDVIVSHGGLTFGSLVLSLNVKQSEVLEIFAAMKGYYRNLGYTKILYKTIPYIFSGYPAQEDLYGLFLSGGSLYRRDVSSVISIGNKIDYSQSKKNLVNRFLKSGVEITEESSFAAFWELLAEVLKKFCASPVHSLQEIELLKARFPENIKLFTLKQEEELLAGLVVFDFGNVVHTQYMANSPQGRKLGALDFINYQLINKVYKDKKYYSFGISTEDNGNVLNAGLIQQKELMGGRSIALDFYEIDLNN